MISAPAGHSAYSSAGTDPEFKFTWAKSLVKGFEAAGNANWASLTIDGARPRQKALTLSVSRDLARNVAGYSEVIGFSAEELSGGKSSTFQAGITRAAGENAQVDFSVSRRLTAAGPDWAGSIGLVVRGQLLGRVGKFASRNR